MSTEQIESITAVELYWRPGCPFCMPLRRPLRRSGLPVREVNIWEDQQVASRVRDATGGDETVPTVFVGQHALANPSVRQVKTVVHEYAPHLLPEVDQSRGRQGFWPFRRRR